MKRNYFDSNVSSDDSLENVLKHIDDWYKIFLEDAKRYESDRKTLDDDEEDDPDDEEEDDYNYYDDEEAKDDAAFADFDRRHVSGYDDFQSDYDYYRNGPKMFNPYDKNEDDEDDNSKYFGEHFGAGFEIDEPRPEDYMDNKTFEDDLAAYQRFVEAGEDCVRRGLEKPEWAHSVKIDDVSDDVDDDYDDEPSSNVKVFRKIYILI